MEELDKHELEYLINSVKKDIKDFKTLDIEFQHKYPADILYHNVLVKLKNKLQAEIKIK